MTRSRFADLLSIIKASQTVINALIKHQEDTVKYTFKHSSLRNLPEEFLQTTKKKLNDIEPSKLPVSYVINLNKYIF